MAVQRVQIEGALVLDILSRYCWWFGNEIRRENHLTWCWNPVNNGITSYEYQLVQDFWTINSITFDDFCQTCVHSLNVDKKHVHVYWFSCLTMLDQGLERDHESANQYQLVVDVVTAGPGFLLEHLKQRKLEQNKSIEVEEQSVDPVHKWRIQGTTTKTHAIKMSKHLTTHDVLVQSNTLSKILVNLPWMCPIKHEKICCCWEW